MQEETSYMMHGERRPRIRWVLAGGGQCRAARGRWGWVNGKRWIVVRDQRWYSWWWWWCSSGQEVPVHQAEPACDGRRRARPENNATTATVVESSEPLVPRHKTGERCRDGLPSFRVWSPRERSPCRYWLFLPIGCLHSGANFRLCHIKKNFGINYY